MADFPPDHIKSGAFEVSDTADDALVADAALGSERAYSELISRYLPSVRRLASLYSRTSADRDDLVSEGILGLMNAVRTYCKGKGASFSTYASVCINNRMLTALKKSAAIYRREEPLDDADGRGGASPEKIVIDREALSEIFSEISENLSQMEKQVFSMYLGGESYEKIAKLLDIDRKSVDNALARVRKKLRRKFR